MMWEAGILITHKELEAWAGRPLTPEDMEKIAQAIPWSSIPDAIGVIAENIRGE